MSNLYLFRHHARALVLQSRQDAKPTILAPPGVVPNYVDPDTISKEVTVTSLTLIVFTSIFVITRLGTKWRVVNHLTWDDLLIVFAFFLALARAIVCTINAEKYDLGYHTWDIKPTDLVAKGEMQKNLLFIGDMLYLISIMCTKIAILLLYVQLFGVRRPFRYLCYAMMGIVFSYCVIFFFIEAFNCNPVEKVWHSLTYTGPFTCFDNSMVEFVIGGFNIATDVTILLLPVPIIWSLQMDPKRKIGLLVVFGTGVFVVASTIVREVIVVRTLRDFDQSWVTVPETVWLTVENDVGIICACLPAFAPLRNTRFFGKILPDSLQYVLRKSGYVSSKGSTSKAASSGAPSNRIGYQVFESGVELVEAPKGDAQISASNGRAHGSSHEDGAIRREVDMEVIYSQQRDASHLA